MQSGRGGSGRQSLLEPKTQPAGPTKGGRACSACRVTAEQKLQSPTEGEQRVEVRPGLSKQVYSAANTQGSRSASAPRPAQRPGLLSKGPRASGSFASAVPRVGGCGVIQKWPLEWLQRTDKARSAAEQQQKGPTTQDRPLQGLLRA